MSEFFLPPSLGGELNSVEEPIAALASAPGKSGVAVIRVSGQQCHQILTKHLKSKNLQSAHDRIMQLANFVDVNDAIIDQVLAVFFKSPRSFTGQDCVEIFCHGGPYIIEKILASLQRSGIRPADPGEFTKRAFLLGKMDLSQAEGIHQMIDAHSEQQLHSARYFAEGHFGKFIESLRKDLVAAMSILAARIDFPDEGDTKDVGLEDVHKRVVKVCQQVDELVATYDSGRIARSGLKVALLGAPNAGKSTLMNALLGQDRAIVTNIPGTTRDYLEEACLIQGRLMNLVDTAGVRKGHGEVEQIGIKRSLEIAQKSDLILLMVSKDSDEKAFQEAQGWTHQFGLQKCIQIISKSDLTGGIRHKEDWIPISAKDGHGLSELKKTLTQSFDEQVAEITDKPFISKFRHYDALQKCHRHLKAFFAASEAGYYDEILAFELQEAARALNLLIGTIDSEDVLDAVFGEFCLGK